MSSEKPIDPDRKKALQDFGASLSDDLKAVLDSMIKEKGEEYICATLDYLKESLEDAIHL
jgi:hypothetical protein